MNKKQKKKLEELKIELDAYVLMSQLVLSMMGKAGKWQKANQKWPHSEDVVYWDDLDGVGVSVDDDGNFKAFNDIDFVCPITLPKFIELIRELAPKPKAKKKPTAKKGKKFRVWFQVMGSSTDSNNIGYAIIQAKDKEQAIEFARQDLTKVKFKNIEITNVDRNEDFDLPEEEQDEDEPLYSYDVDWEADGRHGRYYARSGPYAKDEKEAIQFQREDLTNGFTGFEDELEAEEEEE